MKIRKAVLPVAGIGTRFLPATKVMPKEMLPVVDKPLIQYAVEEARAAGIEEIIFVTSRGKEVLEDHFDLHPELEQLLTRRGRTALLEELSRLEDISGRISSVRQRRPLGLGHAVLCAKDVVGNEPFAVILPDDLVHAKEPVLKQMMDQFPACGGSMVAVMEVAREQTSKYGIVDPDPESKDADLVRVRGLVEKPDPSQAPSNLAVIGRYLLMPEIFEHLERQGRGAGDEIQLTDAMASLLQSRSIHGFRFRGVRYDCGDKVGFQMANVALALERGAMREALLPFLAEQVKRFSAPD